MEVRALPEYLRELARLRDEHDKLAILRMHDALARAAQNDHELGLPRARQIRGSIIELRPSGGQSRHRPLYARIGDVWWLLALAPESQVDPQGFRTALSRAEGRLQAKRRELGYE